MTNFRVIAEIEGLTHISAPGDDDTLDISDFVYEVVLRLGKLDNSTSKERQEYFKEAAAVCIRAIDSLERRITGTDHNSGSR